MLESFVQHGSPELRPGDVTALKATLEEHGHDIDTSRVLPNYHSAHDGRLYCYHFWAYSLAGVPARLVLDLLGLDPVRALPLTNAFVFSLALVAMVGLPWTSGRQRLFVGLLLFSPALGLLLWPHPEIFSFAFVSLALMLAGSGRPTLGVLAAATAAVQNPPLVLLVALLWLQAVLEAEHPRQRLTRAVLAGVAALPALLPALFFQWHYGVFNLSVRPTEAAQSVSVLRALDLVLDPNLGLLLHAPLTVPLGLVGAVGALRARRPWPAALIVGVLPLLMIACTANSNWNNDTSGPSRYVVWMLPLLAFAAVSETGGPPSRPLPRWAAGVLGFALLTQAGAVLLRGGPLAPSDFLRHTPAARYLLDHHPALYNPKPEVFVERTVGQEGPIEGPVVYRDGSGRCRKAWLQWRHGPALVADCGAPPGGMAERLETNAADRDVKRQRTYVSY